MLVDDHVHRHVAHEKTAVVFIPFQLRDERLRQGRRMGKMIKENINMANFLEQMESNIFDAQITRLARKTGKTPDKEFRPPKLWRSRRRKRAIRCGQTARPLPESLRYPPLPIKTV